MVHGTLVDRYAGVRQSRTRTITLYSLQRLFSVVIVAVYRRIIPDARARSLRPRPPQQ
jgi:hypothetical protein